MSDRVPAAADLRIQLGVLGAVERDSGVTQRRLAAELGIAVGLVNAYIRRCVRKGLVKISDAPLNRYAYYLTPSGFAEKSRLTAEYLTSSLDFFRRARQDCTALFQVCAAQGWERVALAGAGDLAEIAVLSGAETGIEIVGVIDAAGEKNCAGRPVVPDLAAALGLAGTRSLDAVVLTDMRAPQAVFDATISEMARRGLAGERLLTPEMLHITRQPPWPAPGLSR